MIHKTSQVSTQRLTSHAQPRKWKKPLLVFGSIALIIHGLIELLSLGMLVNPSFARQEFVFAELSTNAAAVAGLGVIFGVLRLIAAGGILTNQMWGWMLGVLMCVATFAMLTLYLPAGVADAVFSGLALVSLLVARYGSEKIVE